MLGSPDGGGPLPRQDRVRPGPLCLGDPALHGRARGAGVLGDGGPDALLGRELDRRDPRRACPTPSAGRSSRITSTSSTWWGRRGSRSGFRAADRWLRLGRRSALVELALVLAMQVLGGDPESAYLTVLCAFGYALGLARSRTARRLGPASWATGAGRRRVVWIWAGPALVVANVHGHAVQGRASPSRWRPGPSGLLAYVASRRQATSRSDRRACSWAWSAAGILALLLAAVQVLPVLDQIATSVRWAAAGPEDLYRVQPAPVPRRRVDLAQRLRHVHGRESSTGCPILPPAGAHRPSPLSLYVGRLADRPGPRRGRVPRRSALAGLDDRRRPPEFLGEPRRIRRAVELVGWRAVANMPGDDSFYGLLATTLPVLRLFRFPFKLLIFTTLALSALAGLGWDRISAGIGRRRTLAIAIGLLGLTHWHWRRAAGCGTGSWPRSAARESTHAVFGPLDAPAAVGEMLRGLAHGDSPLAPDASS